MQYTATDDRDLIKQYIPEDIFIRYKNTPNFLFMCAVDEEKENQIAGVGAFVFDVVTDIVYIGVVQGYEYEAVYEGIVDEICTSTKEEHALVCNIIVYSEEENPELQEDLEWRLFQKGFYLDYTSYMYESSLKDIVDNMKTYLEKIKSTSDIKPLSSINPLQKNELAKLLRKHYVPLADIDGVIPETSMVHLNSDQSVDGCIITSEVNGDLAVEFLFMNKNNSKVVVELIYSCIKAGYKKFGKEAVITAVASSSQMKKMMNSIFGHHTDMAANYYKVL